MHKISLQAKDRKVRCDVVGFKHGKIAKRISSSGIRVKFDSENVCEIDWQTLKLSDEVISYQYQRKGKVESEGLVIVDRNPFKCGRSLYYGYFNKKRIFIAYTSGWFRPTIHFIAKNNINQLFAGDCWQAAALLCWWISFRE